MNAGRRSTPILIAIAALTTVVGCRDQLAPTAPARTAPHDPSAAIWDGANGIDGNTDVFFLPPMVSNPSGQPGYGDAFQAGLPVAFKIREMKNETVIREFAPAAVTASLSDQLYKVNWDTKADNLDAGITYRIEAWIGTKKIAYADVDVVSSGNQLKNVNTDAFIPLLDDRTLPIKIRVEKGWNCKNNASCASQVITNTPPSGQTYTILTTNDGENAVAFPANWFAAAAAPNGVVVTLEDVTQELSLDRGGPGCGLGRTVMVLEQQCIRITTDPEVTVTNTVIVGACLSDNADKRAQLLKIHEGEKREVKFLRNVPPPIQCPEHIGANPFSNSIARYAYSALTGLGRSVQKVLSPKTAYALDLGVGGAIGIGDGFSVITSGVPLSMSVLAGDQQTALIGRATPVAPQVKLRALHRPSVDTPEGPNDAIVTCAVIDGGGTIGGTASAPAIHNAENDDDGVYTCPAWTLGAGTNTLKVSAANVDDVVLVGGAESPFAGSATFTAFGVDALTIDFELLPDGSAPCNTPCALSTNAFDLRYVSFAFRTPEGGAGSAEIGSWPQYDVPEQPGNHVIQSVSGTGTFVMTLASGPQAVKFAARMNDGVEYNQEGVTAFDYTIRVYDVAGNRVQSPTIVVTRVRSYNPLGNETLFKENSIYISYGGGISRVEIQHDRIGILIDNLQIIQTVIE